jgi:hypothetical protein
MVDEAGFAALASGFWVHIIRQLEAGDLETRWWLDTGDEPTGFVWWCDVSGKDAAAWRERLCAVWRLRDG